MDRYLKGLFIAFAVFLLGGFPALAESRSVVFLNPGKRGEVFWELVARTMEVSARQLDFELEVLWSERNKLTMRDLGLSVAARPEKPDFLVLVNEENAAPPILAAADEAGIATIFISSSLAPEDMARLEQDHGPIRHLLGAIEPDMKAAGWRMAEELVRAAEAAGLTGDDGQIHLLALAGDEITPVSTQRTQGMLDYVATRPDVIVDRLLYANWNRAEAAILTGRYLDLMRARNLRTAGVWAANDPIAIGALDALGQAGLKPGEDAFVVGLNWSAEALDLIKRNELLLSDGGHFLAGGWVMVMLRDFVEGCRFLSPQAPRTQSFETSAIDRATQPELLEVLRDGELERIDFTKFLSTPKTCGAYDFSRDALIGAIRRGDR
ncbi:ABC transporter substrate-binding protein [Neomegalonema sp.]|uniref:ABC transporter substrate-binding protein n=1 Tax=Neomegalonema sp. TaxID=2039713 RepID=UPI002624A7DD|nr:ABC transporter substrate-binding protein [Neomegalonema sp.]MDD2867741.1 ABC transporter substrate-binding protein [Neomegalonema sp.]